MTCLLRNVRKITVPFSLTETNTTGHVTMYLVHSAALLPMSRSI